MIDAQTEQEIEEALAGVTPDAEPAGKPDPDFGHDYPWCACRVGYPRHKCPRKARHKITAVCLTCAQRATVQVCRKHLHAIRRHEVGHDPDPCPGKWHIIKWRWHL